MTTLLSNICGPIIEMSICVATFNWVCISTGSCKSIRRAEQATQVCSLLVRNLWWPMGTANHAFTIGWEVRGSVALSAVSNLAFGTTHASNVGIVRLAIANISFRSPVV
ncbi:MAG: hypothetical protein K9M08_13810 [Pirellula sp.]|nr:hypothetical protein [Pirellula sp.]